MTNHEVGQCNSVQDMLDGIAELCRKHRVTGMAIVLNIQSGDRYTTHQFGMGENDLVVASLLMAEYAKGSTIDHTLN